MEEKTVSQILESVANEICMHHCKWPDVYQNKFDDDDEAAGAMQDEKCNNCPLMRLI